jgi:basic amino acid/polyamine antiporter, APA family
LAAGERFMTDGQITREGLRVAIGFPSQIMLVMGGMVGVGVFVNPAVVARSLHSPELALVAWTLGGVVAILGALVYGELAARLPATGGEYVYLRETYGPLAGFLFGWTLLLVVQTGGMAAVALVFAKNLDVVAGGALPEPVVVVAVLAILAAINCLGVKAGNEAQASLGLLKFGGIAALVAVGLFLAPHARPAAAAASPPSSWADALKAFGAGMIPVVFSYGGWQTTNYVAGEMKDPGRNLARALIAGVLGVMALYLLVNVACIRALGIGGLAATETPTSDVLRLVAGPIGANITAGAIALSALAFLSQSTLTGPRVYFAMARDGVFFRQVGAIADASHVPVIAILVQAAWAILLALSGKYEAILSYVTGMNFVFFGLAASSLFVLRRRERLTGVRHAGYRTPGHPWTTLLFILAAVLVVLSAFWSFPINSLIGYGLLLLGVPPYLLWRRQKLRDQKLREMSVPS